MRWSSNSSIASVARLANFDSTWRARHSRTRHSYDTAIAATLSTVTNGPGGFSRAGAAELPAVLLSGLQKVRDLRYGENPASARGALRAIRRPAGVQAAAGKGTVLHQPPGPRCRRENREGVRRARRRRHQAHESVRGGDGKRCRRCVRPRTRRRFAGRVRRNRRPEPSDRRGHGTRDRVDVHRSRHRTLD